MTTYYAKSSGSILAANAWNTAADGSGTDATFSDGNAAGHTLDLNGKAMTSPDGTTLTCDLLRATTGTLTFSGALTINGAVTYSGTSASGMLIRTTGSSLAVYGGLLTNSSSGVLFAPPAGTYVFSNGTNNVMVNTGTGNVVNATGGTFTVVGHITNSSSTSTSRAFIYNSSSNSGNVQITGNPVNESTSAGAAVAFNCATTTLTITGNPTGKSNSTTLPAAAVRMTAGVLHLDGVPKSENGGIAVYASGGVVSWYGARSLAAGDDCIIQTTGTAILALYLNTTPLTLQCAGNLAMWVGTGGIAPPPDSGVVPSIVRMSASAGVAIVGTGATVTLVSGPTLPDATDVLQGSGQYGYAGDLQTPSYEGGGGGEGYCLISGITWPALDEVDGGVLFGPITGEEYEGTGVNAETVQAAVLAGVKPEEIAGTDKAYFVNRIRQIEDMPTTLVLGQALVEVVGSVETSVNDARDAVIEHGDGDGGWGGDFTEEQVAALAEAIAAEIDVSGLTTEQANQLTEIRAAVASALVRVFSPVASGGQLTVYRSDSYARSGRAITHAEETAGDWPVYTGCELVVVLRNAPDTEVLTIPGTLAGTSPNVMRFAPTHAEVLTLQASSTLYEYRVRGLIDSEAGGNSERETKAWGNLVVR